MALVEGIDKMHSLDTRGAFGVSVNVGRLRMGFNYVGFADPLCGIYSRKKTKKGWKISRMVHYRPKNPRTEAQQNWRDVFKAGVVAFHALHAHEYVLLWRQAKHERMTAYNLFMRRYLSQHRA